MKQEKVAILLPVYKKDNAAYFRMAMDSLLQQTYTNIQILVGVDGPIEGELQHTVDSYASNPLVTLNYFPENRGLAAVLNDLLEQAFQLGISYFARMDADDICYPQRIETQIEFLEANPDIDVVGTSINEINENGENIGKIVNYPSTPAEARAYFSKRDPLAHPSVLFRKSYFDKAGCLYRPEFRKNQDTMLWFDGLKKGVNIANIAEPLLYFRVTNDFFATRRNGYRFAKGLLDQRKIINRELGYGIGATIYAYILFCVRIAPTWLKKLAYKIQ